MDHPDRYTHTTSTREVDVRYWFSHQLRLPFWHIWWLRHESALMSLSRERLMLHCCTVSTNNHIIWLPMSRLDACQKRRLTEVRHRRYCTISDRWCYTICIWWYLDPEVIQRVRSLSDIVKNRELMNYFKTAVKKHAKQYKYVKWCQTCLDETNLFKHYCFILRYIINILVTLLQSLFFVRNI